MDIFGRLRREASDQIARVTDLRRKGVLANAARRIFRSPSRVLPLYWFRAERNFGDMISEAIVRNIWGVEPVYVSPRYKGKLLAVGSVLGAAQPGDVVWGSGLIRPKKVIGRDVTFLAVRGPRTRGQIDGDVPEIYGDPALLLPSIYRPRSASRRYDIGLMPHYVDREVMKSEDPAVLFIDVQEPDWSTTIDRIVSCDVLISSSLHGIIVAEAYGVPAVWVQPRAQIIGGSFKFLDYFESTGREGQSPCNFDWGLSVLERSAMATMNLDPSPLIAAMSQWMDRTAVIQR